MEKLLKKVRRYVPFVWNESRVSFGGDHVLPKESYTRNYRWQNGWREEGELLLDNNGSIVGDIVHVYSNGVNGTSDWEEIESFPTGEAAYLLYYNVKFDTEEEEWATLYKISK